VSTKRAIITGTGSYLPEKILTNADLEKIVDTTDDWIKERSGIHQRHIAADNQATSDLALEAANKALEDAGINGSDIDLIVLATSTPDQTFPATAVTIQAEIGMTHGAAFDVQAVCSGFVYGLTTANNAILCGQANRALVIGAECFSRILDWEDRSTCVLFGDGAGAVILEASEQEGNIKTDTGILGCHLRSDGRYRDKLYVDGGVSSTKTVGHLRMSGREVFRHAVANISSIVNEALEVSGFNADDIDWFVPHQANKRILDGTAKKVGIPDEKVVITLDKQGNTSAASIPLALDHARRDGRINAGDLIMFEAMGGGFTWGSVLARI